MRIAEVDCTRDQSVCERLGVKSYPTFKVVTGGSFYDYSGPRGEDDFAQYVTEGYKVLTCSWSSPLHFTTLVWLLMVALS